MKNKGPLLCLRNAVLCLYAVCLIIPCACTANGQKGVRIISWNLQTFFDSHTGGNEYAAFRGSKSSWSREKYEKRLDRLASFIKKYPADIYVFQEIENQGILQDIANRCTGSAFLPQKPLYACFASEADSALGIGVLARPRIEQVKIHRTDIRSVTEANSSKVRPVQQPSLRPLLQIRFKSGGKNFTLFTCHWKSKRGGKTTYELWHDLQEKELAEHIIGLNKETEGMPVIVCGDFNRNLSEFDCNAEVSAVYFEGYKSKVTLTSAWLYFTEPTMNEPSGFAENKDRGKGSYYFKGKWEKIDHFFYNDFVKAADFYAMNTGAHTDNRGIPRHYDLHNGSGYSDHIPLYFEFFPE